MRLSNRHERRKRQSASEKGQISTRYTSCICQLGDSLVFIFPLAPMLTFTSAVGKLNVRVLWHHHMLLQVISQSYCQVFVKSYNFVFEKIDKEGSPVKSDQNKAISVHVLWVSFHHRSTPVLSSSHQKINFLHYISVTAVKCTIIPVQRNSF